MEFLERTTGPRARRRLGQVVFALAIVLWACASAPAPQTPEPGATQEVLAARIRTVTIGEARPEQEEALRQIAAIEPGEVDADLRAAMAEAFVVMRGRQEFEGVKHTLENLLAPLYSTNALAAALSGIPSRPGPTGEETTAAILAARLPVSEVSDSLRAAMNHAVSVISGGRGTGSHGHRRNRVSLVHRKGLDRTWDQERRWRFSQISEVHAGLGTCCREPFPGRWGANDLRLRDR